MYPSINVFHCLLPVPFLFQVVPSFLVLSSCHFLRGRPLDLFPLLGCHSVQRLVHLLPFIVICVTCLCKILQLQYAAMHTRPGHPQKQQERCMGFDITHHFIPARKGEIQESEKACRRSIEEDMQRPRGIQSRRRHRTDRVGELLLWPFGPQRARSHNSNNDNSDRFERRDSRFLFNLLTAPRTVSNTYAQVAGAQSCANHVQHIGQHVVCHMVRRDSSAIKFDRIEIAFILASSDLLKPLIDGGEETGVPGQNP